MTFAWQPQQFATIDLFKQYLAGLSRPAWVRAATIHHTWKPEAQDWRGMTSMKNLGTFYRDVQKWPAGPHLFLCAGAPKKADDGIFIGTPLGTKGVHAGTCNSDRWGIEIVGNYDPAPWPAPVEDLVYGVLLALAAFGGYDPATVNGHRECGSTKTCPGKSINMNAVRVEVKRRAAMTGPTPVPLPPGTFPVDARLQAYWEQSGGLWQSSRYALGYALTPLINNVQRFERGVVRINADGSVDGLLLTEAVELL